MRYQGQIPDITGDTAKVILEGNFIKPIDFKAIKFFIGCSSENEVSKPFGTLGVDR